VRSLLIPIAIVAMLVASLGHAPAARAATSLKVAIIVGPVGDELTPVYISLAQAAADAAESRGATVAEAFSPDATAENVLKAVEGANVVIYFGHGIGTPNPYTDTPDPATTNGWGLDGPDGALTYYGEAWIAQHARPAPGWVMIYSNACYAPGAGEGFDEPATEQMAAQRVAAYSRAPLAELGASAYFATDFYAGAAQLVGTLLDQPGLAYGDVFAAEPRYDADGVVALANPLVEGAETWLQKSPYFDGESDYWYAFAGDPAASLSGAVTDGPTVARAAAIPPLTAVNGLVTGEASSYTATGDWEGRATVALPLEIGGGIPSGEPSYVLVCADRCVTLPVVDSCPCYVGTADQRVANLSVEAWALLTDLPIEEGLVQVEIYIDPIQLPPDARPAA
jgi:hypothetical protein